MLSELKKTQLTVQSVEEQNTQFILHVLRFQNKIVFLVFCAIRGRINGLVSFKLSLIRHL